jgi:RND family efflux transporter MFP subunit
MGYQGDDMKLTVSQGGSRSLKARFFHGLLPTIATMAVGSVFAQTSPVPITVVQAKAVASAYELDGVIQPVKQSTIAAQAAGRIASLAVKAGDKVKAGQVLATIDDREASAGVQRSQAQINQADAELRNARANVERTRDLQSKGFVSKAALDTAETQYKGAAAVRDQATASALQSSISQGFTRVTAPYDGWVLQTHAEAGDLAVPGRPLVTIYAPLPLRAVVQVPASRVQLVRASNQTQVQLDDVSNSAQRITPVARTEVPSADPVSQTTEWRLDLSSKDSANLLPGQQVRVRFPQPQAASMIKKLTVPQASIVRRGELTAVYVVVNGAFSLRAVRLGANLGTDGVEVLAGVDGGESIALDPIRAGFAKAVPAPSAPVSK